MKLFRRTSALVMALVLVLSLSLTALAADFDNMADGFNYDGEDAEVNINLKADDEYGYYEAKEGKTYNISSDNGSALVYSSLGGSGTVNIDGDTIEEALDATDQVNVTINGDVDASLSADDQSSLTVNGDANNGVSAYGQAEVTVNGDVNGRDGNPNEVDYSDPWSFSDGGSGVYALGDATVTVNGNVTGGDAYGSFGYAGNGISARQNATVIVNGNVSGGNVTADPNTEAYVTEDGSATSSRGGSGVAVSEAATVTIGGDVTGGSTNGDKGVGGSGLSVSSYSNDAAFLEDPILEPITVNVAGAVTGGEAENGTDADGIYIKLTEDSAAPSITVSDYDSASGEFGVLEYTDLEDFMDFAATRDLTQDELDALITVTGESSEAVYYGTSFHYSRGQLVNEYGVCVRALFAFGSDWEETVEDGTVTITSAEEKGEVVVTVDSLKVMMDVGIETILFNGTKLVLKDAVAERSAYDTYTITASAILLNGAAV